jgi:hypothetical protein
LFLGYNAKPWQGVEQISATQKYPLGTYFDDFCGARFRYCKNGAGALVAGDLVQTAALGGATTTLQDTGIVGVASLAADTRLYIAAMTTLQPLGTFDEGWAGIFDNSLTATYTRRIKSSTEIEHTTWVDAYIDLYEPVGIALTVSDTIALMANPYKNIVVGTAATLTGMGLGGVRCAVTAAYYCWVQTRGWFGVHIKDGALAAGMVEIGASTAGTPTAYTELLFGQPFGVTNAAWADEAAGLVFLMCE